MISFLIRRSFAGLAYTGNRSFFQYRAVVTETGVEDPGFAADTIHRFCGSSQGYVESTEEKKEERIYATRIYATPLTSNPRWE